MLVKVIYLRAQMVVVAQLVRAPDCGSGGRGFESHLPPFRKPFHLEGLFLCFLAQLLSVLGELHMLLVYVIVLLAELFHLKL